MYGDHSGRIVELQVDKTTTTEKDMKKCKYLWEAVLIMGEIENDSMTSIIMPQKMDGGWRQIMR